MGRFQVHKCRFVEWNAHAITAVAFSRSGKLLAVARESGVVEVWNVEYQWFNMLVCATISVSCVAVRANEADQTIPGEGPDSAARSLVWVPRFDEERGVDTSQGADAHERLFSAGLGGEIIEWDLSLLVPKVRPSPSPLQLALVSSVGIRNELSLEQAECGRWTASLSLPASKGSGKRPIGTTVWLWAVRTAASEYIG